MESIFSAYFVCRLIIGLLDGVSDILVGFHLLSRGHPYWCLAVLVWVVAAVFISCLYVLLGRCRQGDPMTGAKFLVLGIKVHAEIVAAYFQSGPSLIVQLVIVWSGVHQHDFEVFVSPSSWAWFWAWLDVFSILMSFLSVLFTTVRYNNEPGPGRRVFWSIVWSVSTFLYRVFIISLLFKLAPVITLLILVVLYLLTACIHYSWGDGSSCLLHAFGCLLLSMGHTHGTCAKPGYSVASGITEAERTRINQEGLFRRIQKFSFLHLVYNILFIIPFITFTELWLHPALHLHTIPPVVSSRLFLYLTVATLLLLSQVLTARYYIQAKKAVTASLAWTQIPAIVNQTENNVVIPIPSSPSRLMSFHHRAPSPVRPASVYNPSIPQPATLPQPNSTLYPHLPSAHSAPSAPPAPPAPTEDGDINSKPLPAGNSKCSNDNCVTCAWLVEGPTFSSTVTSKKYRFMTPVSCTTDTLIYLVTCKGCRKQYVGKTEQTLRQRHYGHRREIETQNSPLGQHFGSICGYKCWSIQMIDKCHGEELARREGYWQHELRTLVPEGLNIRDELGGRQKI